MTGKSQSKLKMERKKQEAEIIQVFVFADTYTPLWEFLICKE